ncbi:MAG: ABC transporter permease subunit [Candidatus Thermoplasmatota archaeon]|nr:ABC transporter permease subunit [Candidatus Thermoplasmatota archaeon]
MGLKEKYILKSNSRWSNKGTWQPLLISVILIISLAIIHKAYWVSTTETNPEEIWEKKELIKNGNNWTITFEEDVGESITFKGVLRTAPKFEVYKNDTFVPGKFSEGEGLIYSEDLYGKTMLNVSGMRILVNDDLSNKFFVSEIVTIKATLINNISTFDNNGELISLEREGWVAETDDISLSSAKDNYFFGTELLILFGGLYLSLKRITNLKEQTNLIWHLAKFELKKGIKSPRMIVLGVIFTLFIIGMGWLLGDLQNGDPESAFFVQNANGALQQLCFFVFFVVSLAAIGVSVDSFHNERQANTLNILLSKPINRETIVIGKAVGLSLVVGIPAFVAQILGLLFMINAGETPSTSGIIAFILCGQVMIFTLVCFQLCFAISARSGTDVVMYGLGMWLLFAVVWNLLIYAISFALGIDVTAEDFENDPRFQSIASHMGMLNPGYVYQFSVGLLTHRTLAIDLEGIPGWLILLALALWPITCLRTATKLFKREVKG